MLICLIIHGINIIGQLPRLINHELDFIGVLEQERDGENDQCISSQRGSTASSVK
jgi:hypothetical protein